MIWPDVCIYNIYIHLSTSRDILYLEDIGKLQKLSDFFTRNTASWLDMFVVSTLDILHGCRTAKEYAMFEFIGERSLASGFTNVLNIAVHAVLCCLCHVEMRHEETVMICQTFFKIAGKPSEPVHLFDVMQCPLSFLTWTDTVDITGSVKGTSQFRLCQDDRKRPRGLCVWAFWGWSFKGVLPEDFWM